MTSRMPDKIRAIGYSTHDNPTFKPDLTQIDTDGLRIEFYKNSDYDKIVGLLNEAVKSEINPDDVYEIELGGGQRGF